MDDGSKNAADRSGAAGGRSFIPLNPNSIPTAAELKNMFSPFMTKNGNYSQDDVIEDRIYDTDDITASTTNNLTLFNTASTDEARSNMYAAGQLPSQEAFYMTGIKFVVYNSADVAWDIADIKEIFRRGYYTLYIANKPYISGDLIDFINPIAPLAYNTRGYSINPFKTWNLRVRQVIPPQVNFKCSITLTVGSLQSGTYSLKGYLCGYRYRAIQ